MKPKPASARARFNPLASAGMDIEAWEAPVTAEEHAREWERRAASHRAQAQKEADEKERLRLSALACVADGKAQSWRQKPQEPSRASWGRGDKINGHLEELLARLAAGDREAMGALYAVVYKLASGLEALVDKGDTLAVKLLLDVAEDSTARFYRRAHARPDLFLQYTQRKLQIPVPFGLNKESIDGAKAFAEKMQLGKEAIFKGRRWALGGDKPPNRANRLVFRLVHDIEQCRVFMRIHRFAVQAGKAPVAPTWTVDAERLQEFNPDTWREWADVAWKILQSESPTGKVWKHPELLEEPICEVRYSRKDPYYGKTVNSDSIPQNDVKEALFAAFKRLALAVTMQ